MLLIWLNNLGMGANQPSGPTVLFLPYMFTTTLLAGQDTDPFGIDPGQTTLITTGLDTGP